MAVGPRQPGNWWNEHVNCAIALWCDEATFRAVQACAEDRRAHTGTYNLITYNCLTFCDEALAAAASTCSRKAAASCTPSSPRTPLGTWAGWRAPIPSRRGSTGSPSASRRQTACAPSRTSLVGTSRWNKRCDLGIYLVQSRLSGRRAPHDARIAESRRRGGVGCWTAVWGKRPRTAAGRGTRAERETGDEKIKSEEGR